MSSGFQIPSTKLWKMGVEVRVGIFPPQCKPVSPPSLWDGKSWREDHRLLSLGRGPGWETGVGNLLGLLKDFGSRSSKVKVRLVLATVHVKTPNFVSKSKPAWDQAVKRNACSKASLQSKQKPEHSNVFIESMWIG